MPNLIRETRAKERGGLVIMPQNPGGAFTIIPFLFNPTEFSEEEGHSWDKKTIPMQGDPAVQYVGGEGGTFKFQLILEAERLAEFVTSSAASSLSGSIEQYHAQIEMLKQPQVTDPGLLYEGSPPRIMVAFGTFFRIGYINKTSTTYTDFFVDGRMRSAEMEINMLLSFGRARQYKRQATSSFVRGRKGSNNSVGVSTNTQRTR